MVFSSRCIWVITASKSCSQFLACSSLSACTWGIRGRTLLLGWSSLDCLGACWLLRGYPIFDRTWQKNFLMAKSPWIPSLMSTRASESWLTCGGWKSRSSKRWCSRDKDFHRRSLSRGQPMQRQHLKIPTLRMQTLLLQLHPDEYLPLLLPSQQDAFLLRLLWPRVQDQPFLIQVLRILLSHLELELRPWVSCHSQAAHLSLYHSILQLFPKDRLAFHHILVLSSSEYFGAPDLRIGAYCSFFSPYQRLNVGSGKPLFFCTMEYKIWALAQRSEIVSGGCYCFQISVATRIF